MARPRKVGLDYFSLDVDILTDIKIKKLIRRKGGGRALSVYIALLCQIYKKGYFFEYDEDTSFLLSVDLDETEDYVSSIIQYCIEIGLFDKDTYEKHSILTSRAIQERFMYVCKTTQRRVNVEKYSLLAENAVIHKKNAVNTVETDVNTEKTSDNTEKTSVNTDTNPVKSTKTRRKDSENQSKQHENALKENKSKGKAFKVSTTTTTSTANVRDEGFAVEKEVEIASAVKDDLHEEVTALKEEEQWLRSTACYLCIPPNTLLQSLDRFEQSCQIRGKTRHASTDDCKQHFIDWYNKEQQQQKKKSTNQRGAPSSRRAEPVPAGVREEDFALGFK